MPEPARCPPAAPAMRAASPLPWLLAIAVAAALFLAFPGIDVAVSGWFYARGGFAFESDAPVEAMRRALMYTEDVAGTAAFALALAARRGPVMGQGARVWLYQGLVFLLGPALMVNAVVKPIWARPRPANTALFGGADPFQPFWQIEGQCPKNCSFFSGEVSAATALVLMGVMLARANRESLGKFYPAAMALAIFPLPYSFWQRIAAGRHYLSDAVFALLVTALLASLLARAMRIAR